MGGHWELALREPRPPLRPADEELLSQRQRDRNGQGLETRRENRPLDHGQHRRDPKRSADRGRQDPGLRPPPRPSPGDEPSSPVCGISYLAVGVVGEVGDRNAIGHNLLGGRGHPQDSHLPQLQASPLTGHVHQLVDNGVLAGAERPGAVSGQPGQVATWMAPLDSRGQRSGRHHATA